jgi:hypothetical protein
LLNPDGGAVRVSGNDPREARNRQRTGALLQVARVPETLRAPTHLDRSGRAQFRIAELRIGRGILSIDRELPWEVSKRVLPQRQACMHWGDALVSINGMPTSRKTEAELESLFSAREPTMMHLQIDRVGSLKNINFRLEKAEDIARENGKRFVNGEIVPLWANDKDLHCF